MGKYIVLGKEECFGWLFIGFRGFVLYFMGEVKMKLFEIIVFSLV